MAGVLPRRISEKISLSTSECWLWTAARIPTGYGQIKVKGRGQKAHRLVYQILVGPIPDGFDVDHLCRTRHCVNPEHLEAVSHRENMLRGNTVAAINAAKTHCSNGHEYTDENTYQYRNGSRHCRVCRREWKRKRAA